MDKKIVPYLVVYHSASEQTAVYNRDYELMFEGASAALIEYVNNLHPRLRHQGFTLSFPEQQPSWVSENIKKDCISFFCYDDNSKMSELENIPLG